MARAQRVDKVAGDEYVVTVDPNDVRAAIDQGEDPDPLISLLSIGKRLSLFRQDDRLPTKFYYLTSLDASPTFLDAVKAEFGGGNYRVKVYDERGKFISEGDFAIDPRFVPGSTAVPLSGASSGTVPGSLPPSPAPSLSPPLAQGDPELRMILAQQTRLLEALLTHATQAPRVDPLEMALRIAEAMRPQPQQGGSVAEAMAMFREGLQLGQNVGGDSYMPVVESLGKPLLSLLERNSGQAQAVPEGVKLPAGAPPGAVAAGPNGSTGGASAVFTLDRYLAQAIPQLLPVAKAGKPAGTYASVLLDSIPESVYGLVKETVDSPGFTAGLLVKFPSIKPYEAWFDSLRAEISAQLSEDDGNEGDDEDEAE